MTKKRHGFLNLGCQRCLETGSFVLPVLVLSLAILSAIEKTGKPLQFLSRFLTNVHHAIFLCISHRKTIFSLGISRGFFFYSSVSVSSVGVMSGNAPNDFT